MTVSIGATKSGRYSIVSKSLVARRTERTVRKMETGWVMLSAKLECKETSSNHQNMLKRIHVIGIRESDAVVNIGESMEDEAEDTFGEREIQL